MNSQTEVEQNFPYQQYRNNGNQMILCGALSFSDIFLFTDKTCEQIV